MRTFLCLLLILLGLNVHASMSEQDRIRTHLNFVYNLLNDLETTGMTAQQKINRKEGLAALRKYVDEGLFPQNRNFPNARIPYFIDEDGTPCAVGQIMISSGHQSLALKILAQNNHVYLDQVDDPEVAIWVQQSGFSLDELRLIQPAYSYTPRYKDLLLEKSYLGDEKQVRKILEAKIAKVRLNLALQIAAKTADSKLVEKSNKERQEGGMGIYYEPPPFVGQWAAVAQALIEKGADPLAKNSKGESAVDLAKDPAVKAVLTGTKKLASR